MSEDLSFEKKKKSNWVPFSLGITSTVLLAKVLLQKEMKSKIFNT